MNSDQEKKERKKEKKDRPHPLTYLPGPKEKKENKYPYREVQVQKEFPHSFLFLLTSRQASRPTIHHPCHPHSEVLNSCQDRYLSLVTPSPVFQVPALRRGW